MAIRVECINKTPRRDPRERIRSIGGRRADDTRWRLSQANAIAGIEAGRWSFYVERPVGDRVDLVVATSRYGYRYLRTTADADEPNNLLSLPECPLAARTMARQPASSRASGHVSDPQPAEPLVIVAAGGLVWRREPARAKLAVVHRRGGDWTLPEGELLERESPDAAALRAVSEEVGCVAEITGFAGRIAYLVEGVPKLVLFWHMSRLEGSSIRSAQVDALSWLTVPEATSRLSHERERALVAGTGR